MKSFGEAFRQARLLARVTLRQISEQVGKSIGYLSDIEHNRKGPPDIETVRQIEEVLKIRDNSLVDLASKLRTQLPSDLTQRIQMRPQLSELLLRADGLTDDGLEELIAQAMLIPEKSKREE